jgi:hypothetical protein
MQEIIKKILNRIEVLENDKILTENNNEFEINKENFSNINLIKTDKKVTFIDGGNLEILRSPSISLFFNRIYACTYQKNKRVKKYLVEFFLLITTKKIKDEIFFETEYFFVKNKINLQKYEFNSYDKTITQGNSRAKISIIGNVIRRFSEIILASEIDETDYIVIDGSLEDKFTHEINLIKKIKKQVCGFCKTNELLTKNGNTTTLYLTNNTDKKSWIYYLGNIKYMKTYFTKLIEKSKYIFRIDFMNTENTNEIISLLANNSKDPIFYGYPYGLIDADKFARVSNREKEQLMIKLRFMFKEKFEKLLPLIHSLDAHSILDNIG